MVASGPLARIRAISPAERRLLAEAVAVLAVASFSIALFPFRRVAALARLPEAPSPGQAEQQQRIRTIGWAVTAAARRVPWRAKCIEQGFAVQWMLRRRAVPSIIHYGVARRDGELVAHVWVRSGSIDVIGCENAADFSEIAQFPPPSAEA
jgi:hypothetical protein